MAVERPGETRAFSLPGAGRRIGMHAVGSAVTQGCDVLTVAV